LQQDKRDSQLEDERDILQQERRDSHLEEERDILQHEKDSQEEDERFETDPKQICKKEPYIQAKIRYFQTIIFRK